MALAEYQVGDRTYLFEDDDVPAGAIRVPKHAAKAVTPANKARKPANKAA